MIGGTPVKSPTAHRLARPTGARPSTRRYVRTLRRQRWREWMFDLGGFIGLLASVAVWYVLAWMVTPGR